MTQGNGNMQRPGWDNKWNPNTLLTIAQLAVMLVVGGVLWQKLESGMERNAEAIGRHDDEFDRTRAILDTLSSNLATYANVPYRITALESRVGDVERTSRLSENTIIALQSDIKYMRDVLERLDPQTNGRKLTPLD